MQYLLSGICRWNMQIKEKQETLLIDLNPNHTGIFCTLFIPGGVISDPRSSSTNYYYTFKVRQTKDT